jgi:hypothetical protein
VLQAALQAAWAEILVETASSFHGLDSPSKAALIHVFGEAILQILKIHNLFIQYLNNTYFSTLESC